MTQAAAVLERVDAVEIAARLADNFRQRGIDSKAFPTAELHALTESGLLQMALPPRLGGDPHLQEVLLPVLKEIGRGSLPLGRVFEGHVNALLLIDEFGSPRQMDRVAQVVITRRNVLGVWNTGPEGSPKLTLTSEGNYRMSGGKTFATGARQIQRAIVTAALPDGGWQMCLVPLSEVEMRVKGDTWSPLGMEASESYAVEFPDITLTLDSLIGSPGDYYADPMFTGGAMRFCAVQLGGAQALFDSVCDFLKAQRRENDALQLQRLGQMAVMMETGTQWIRRAGEWLAGNRRKLPVQALMMRIAIEDICTQVVHLTQVTVGARGLTADEPFARTLRDLQMYLRQGGYDHAFQVAGRHALEERRPLV